MTKWGPMISRKKQASKKPEHNPKLRSDAEADDIVDAFWKGIGLTNPEDVAKRVTLAIGVRTQHEPAVVFRMVEIMLRELSRMRPSDVIGAIESHRPK